MPSVTLPLRPPALRLRRASFALSCLLIYAAFLAVLWHGLGPSWLRPVLVGCVAVFLPWTVLGLANAVIGLALLRPTKPLPAKPITLRTAIIMTVRNEEPNRAIARLRVIEQSLDRSGAAESFAFFLLSDSDDPVIAAEEEAAMQAWRAASVRPAALHYRRRPSNDGFKAGNIMAFCREQGAAFDLMLPLDADSLMSAHAILHLVRLMQAQPRVGIIQGLVTGLPAATPFARIFQFGMRAGMRSYTAGQAWWTAECGPYWGHNAIIRIAPFREHCALPTLSGGPPFGGAILSHDQVEAALIRRAGWEVRLQPIAGGSYEENPPTLIDHIGRDLRWCRGNLQYLRLLRLPGLAPVSRFQLVWAILMFLGLPAWTLTILLLPLAAQVEVAHPAWLAVLYATFLFMDMAPKLAGYLYSAADRHRASRYGGRSRLLAGAAVELVFGWLKYSITSLRVTGFMLGLLVSRSAPWPVQRRDASGIRWAQAARVFWPETLFGLALNTALLATAPSRLPWLLPLTLGYVLAIPFAVLTASPRLGRWCARIGLGAIPEERSPPPELTALGFQPAPWSQRRAGGETTSSTLVTHT